MKLKLYGFFFLISSCLVTPSEAQNLEELLRMLKDNKLEEIKARLPSLVTKYPNKPELLYIQAFLETDGQQALKLYKKIVEEHSTSAYADDALFKIAQYYFALGLYVNARKSFTNLVTLYPESPLADEAQYFAARCLFAMGQVTSARNEMDTFLRNHSDSQLAKLARQD
ncbi:MAG: tetratricopeptide repeat protein, partial [candidate division KSB1 bacterium]|nr:tetratricopeptide repeat protein [candidate division KSB1 bacterium]